MRNGWKPGPVQTRCYRQGNGALIALGAALVALGLLLLFLCIPGWAWAALVGTLFIGAGYLLIRLGRSAGMQGGKSCRRR